MLMSSTSSVVLLSEVVVPCTVRLPVIVASPLTVTLVLVISSLVNVPFIITSLNVTLSVVPYRLSNIKCK